MNRELKLALIVGFALVLVVTVLISDHLSSGRGQRLASEVPESPALITAATPTPGERDAAFIRSGAPAAQPEPQPQPMPNTGPQAMGSAQPGAGRFPPQDAPVVISQGRDAAFAAADHLPGESSLRDVVSRMGGRIENGTIYLQPQPQPLPGSTPGALPASDNNGSPSNAPTQPQTPAAPQPRPGPSERVNAPLSNPAAQPAATEYTVVEGDNLYKIAKRFLGDGKQWRKITEANTAIPKDGQVRVGQKIRIPAASTPGKAQPSSPAAPASPSAARTYTVKKGDTLGLIAWHELGTMKRSGEILALNKGVITDEDNVPLGAVIKLPAR